MKKQLSIMTAGIVFAAAAGCGGAATQTKTSESPAAAKQAAQVQKVDKKVESKEDLTYREIIQREFKYVEGVVEDAQDSFGQGVLFLHQFPPDYVHAEESFKAAIQKDPSFPESYFNLGQIYERLGKPQKAIEMYEAAAAKASVEGVSSKLDARAYIGKVYLGMAKRDRDYGRFAEATQNEVKAKQIFDEIIAEDSENLIANNALALYWLMKGDAKTAEDFVRKVLLKAPRDVVALNTRGLINLQAGELKIAKWVFEQKALKFDPNSIEALTNLGVTYLKMGDTPMGVTSFEKALQIDPNNYEARMNVAAIYLNFLHYDAAREQYEAALTMVTDSVEAMIGLGSCYLGLLKPDRAVETWTRAISLSPKTYDLYLRVAKAYETKLNNLDKAIEVYEKYLELANPPANDPVRGRLPVLREMAKNGGMAMPAMPDENQQQPVDGQPQGGDLLTPAPAPTPAPAEQPAPAPAPEPKVQEPAPAPTPVEEPAPAPKADEPAPAPTPVEEPAPAPKADEPAPAPTPVEEPAPAVS